MNPELWISSVLLFLISHCDGLNETIIDFTQPITSGFDASESENDQRYIVKFKNKKYFRKAYDSLKMSDRNTHIMKLSRQNSEVMTLKTLKDVKEWEERDDVEYVERDHKVYLQAEDIPFGVEMVDAFEVSDKFVSNQKVCIIDSGIDRGHQDLPKANKMSGTSSGAGPWSRDGNGHGTHVAGTIAAIGGNDKGVVGIIRNGELNLHIVRVFGDSGNWAWQSSLIAAADECVANGSTIISMSLGGPSYSFAEESAFENIYNSGVLLIAAAGNNGSSSYSYPASYNSVISVGAVKKNKVLASFSQRNNQINLVAPGVNVMSTIPQNSYRSFSGTSMSTPHVSGVAALVWSHFPSRTAQEVRQALELSAEDLGPPGKDNEFGYGLVNAQGAFNLLSGGCLSVCTDSPIGWYDSDGPTFNCDWYGLANNCGSYGSDEKYRNDGKVASEACCSCGGGKTDGCGTESSSPSGAPTTMLSESPTATPSILPSENPSISPSQSAVPSVSSSPSTVPSKLPSAEPSVSPSDIPTKAPSIPSKTPSDKASVSPSVTPAKTPSSDLQCNDTPENWYDADGVGFNCAWYQEGNNCERYGNSYKNFGATANVACCACGGGSNPACRDIENWWYDSGGTQYDCDWYKKFNRCQRFGNSYENFGYTANKACCACKS